MSATAMSGEDKNKAAVAEKAEKMKTSDPQRKRLVLWRKKGKIYQTELEKQQAFKANSIRKGEAHHTGVRHEAQAVRRRAGSGGHDTGVGHETDLGGQYMGVGQLTGVGMPTALYMTMVLL